MAGKEQDTRGAMGTRRRRRKPSAAGWDHARLAARAEADRANAAAGKATCVNCFAGLPLVDCEKCPACGYDTMPF